MNFIKTHHILTTLAQWGVEEIIACAGARNSPLIAHLEQCGHFRVRHFFEERSASFFALGRAVITSRPVAILTTSGTAAAELLPAAIEAYYQGLPLIFVTADRPVEYRGTGAPQSIEQVGLFGSYVEKCLDIQNENFEVCPWTQQKPIHLNVCFAEPLLEGEIPPLLPVADLQDLEQRQADVPGPDQGPPSISLKNFEAMAISNTNVIHCEKPLVIVSGLTLLEAATVASFLQKWQLPVYAEATSQLWGRPEVAELLVRGGEQAVFAFFKADLCQSVIRIGGVPTLRFWRDLENQFSKTPVYSFSRVPLTGLSRPAEKVQPLRHLRFIEFGHSPEVLKNIKAIDQTFENNLNRCLRDFPKSEPSLLQELSKKIDGRAVYLGNSLPIRLWDLVGPRNSAYHRVIANRGANGIEGQVSTFLGCIEKTEAWAILGDLTTLYDLSGLWASRFLKSQKVRLVIVNNHGGMIFKNMFGRKSFLNEHHIEFSHWAQMWGWDYRRWEEINDVLDLPDRVIIELCPDPAQSELFHQEFKK